MDKTFLPFGGELQARYNIIGGEQPYTHIEWEWYFDTGILSGHSNSGNVKNLPTGALKIKTKGLTESYNAYVVLTVRDSAGNVIKAKSNVIPYESISGYFTKQPLVIPNGEEITIDYQIIGGSGSYDLTATWTTPCKAASGRAMPALICAAASLQTPCGG